MATLPQDMLNALEDLNDEKFKKFKWVLQQPKAVEGLEPLKKSALADATSTDTVDLIKQNYPGDESRVMRTVLEKVDRKDLAKRFYNTPKGR